LRGRNLNAPVGGTRPDPQFANLVELISDAGARSHSVTLGWNFTRADWRRLIVLASHTWTRSETNTTGAFALPANGPDLDTEWGPTAPTHQGSATVNLRLIERGGGTGLGLSLNLQARSGTPYTITTGHDDNRDGVFNDRPAGVTRNSVRTAAHVTLNGALNYSWRFGPRGLAPDGSPQQLARYGVVWSLNFRNLTNHDNLVGYSGVLTSPLFGQATNVSNPRRFQLSLRFDF
jgi:hypothetical protein